jgi:hypothetical protein|tara:strand:+ start:9703 stop:13236 length:3534 start_codon:yes stop_codon:yes gene_type:complete
MNVSSAAIDSLRSAVQKVRLRRRTRLLLTQTSVSLLVICALALLFISLQMLLQFPPLVRSVLLSILVFAAICMLLWQNRQVRRLFQQEQYVAHFVEEQLPELEQRLLTSLEYSQQHRAGTSAQLVEKLWVDTHAKIESRPIENISVPLHRMWPSLLVLPVLIGVVLLLSFWDSFYIATEQVLLPWSQSAVVAAPPRQLAVEPGDVRTQRGNEAMLTARFEDGIAHDMTLNLQWDRVNWTKIAMQPGADKGSFSYYMPSVNEPFAYYVESGDVVSRTFNFEVFDLPQLVRLEVRYEYPAYTGLENRRELDGGDIEAPEGTRVELSMLFNKPLRTGTMEITAASADLVEELRINGKVAAASLQVSEDATYIIHVVDREQLSNDNGGEFLIRSIPDSPPQIDLQKPGKDQKVTPLEEVVIAAQASDDYGLTDFRLSYGVIGQDEQQVDFLVASDSGESHSSAGEQLLYLEDLSVQPGDFVSYYLSATDNNGLAGPNESVSDIYFLEVVPTEAEFRSASGSGRSGGRGGGASSALVMNQKDIIAATWKLKNRKDEVTPEEFQRDADTITQSQQQVQQRALMSLQRLTERQSFSDETYDQSVEFMGQAVREMEAALEQLQEQLLAEALIPEQAALQAIMKAEASSRKREISANRRGGRGGSGQSREREELRELFGMEVGQLQNRYETPQEESGGNSARDDSLDALKELARRQEKLNRAQRTFARRQEQMTEEQKRPRLEQLRRQQEELTRRTRQLAQELAQAAQNDQSEATGTNSRSSDLQEIADQMQAAAENLSASEPGLAAAKSQKALDQLRRQAESMEAQQATSVNQLARRLKQQAEEMKKREAEILKDTEVMMRRQSVGSKGGNSTNREATEDLLIQKDELLRQIGEIEKGLQSIIGQNDEDQNDIKLDASAVRRYIYSSRVVDRIDTSKRVLRQDMLNVSFEIEKEIANAIDAISSRLDSLDQAAEPPQEEALQQAAANVQRLRREIENLQQILQQNQRQNGQQNGQPNPQQDSRQNSQQQASSQSGQSQSGETRSGVTRSGETRSGETRSDRAGRRDNIRQSLIRSRALSRELTQRWAGGQSWFADARSIDRQLNKDMIEQFLNQPDLLKQLLIPIIALEKKLAAHAQIDKLRQRLLVTSNEEIPAEYEKLVEQYYKSLSTESGKKDSVDRNPGRQ